MAELTHRQFDRELILQEALTAWLWSSVITPDEENEHAEEGPFDDWAIEHEATPDSATYNQWDNDVDTFLTQAHDLLLELQESGETIHSIGHDIALTRGQHGVGFRDRGYPDHIGEGLTEIAHSLGQIDPYGYKKGDEWLIGYERV